MTFLYIDERGGRSQLALAIMAGILRTLNPFVPPMAGQ